jgi:hypothetical protein
MVMKDDATYENIPKSIYKTCISIFDRPEFDDNIILVSKSLVEPPKRRSDIYFRKLQDTETKEFYFIFEIPQEFEEDLNKILGGDYYHLSNKYKSKLLDFWKTEFGAPLYQLLHSTLRNKHDHRKPLVRELIHGTGGI